MKQLIIIFLSILIFTCSFAKDLVITKLSTPSIKIGNRTIGKGGIFSDEDVIYWSSPNQDMKAKPKSGGIPRHYSAAAFRSKSKKSLSIKHYLMYLNKTNHPSTLSSEMELHEGRNKDKFAEKRIALVIGNSNYENFSPDLDCPISDAEDVSNKLNELGFDTFTLYDANYMDFCNSLTNLNKVAKSDEYNVVLFYYCGHGNQYNGMNYLLPSSAQNTKPEHVEGWVSFDYIFDTFENLDTAICKTRLVFLDACRNTPSWETNNVGSRLDQYKTNGAFVVFSTENYTKALGAQEEESRNTPFGSSFLETVDKPSENITLTINELSESVKEKTEYYKNYGQNPRQVYTFGVGNVDFSFVPGVNIEALLNKTQYYLSIDNPEMAIIFLDEIRNNYNFLDTIQKHDYLFFIDKTYESMLCSSKYLNNIKKNPQTSKPIKSHIIYSNPYFKTIRKIDGDLEFEYLLYNNMKDTVSTQYLYDCFSEKGKYYSFYDYLLGVTIVDADNSLLIDTVPAMCYFPWTTFPLAINNEGKEIIYSEGEKDHGQVFYFNLNNLNVKVLDKRFDCYFSPKEISASFSPNNKYFFYCRNNKISVFDSSNLKQISSFNYEEIDTLFWDDTNQLCIVIDNNIYSWTFINEILMSKFKYNDKIVSMAISDDKTMVAALCSNGNLFINNTNTNVQIVKNEIIEFPGDIEFSKDNSSLWLTDCYDGVFCLDLKSLELNQIKESEKEASLPWPTFIYITSDNKYCISEHYIKLYPNIIDLKNKQIIDYSPKLIASITNTKEVIRDHYNVWERAAIASKLFRLDLFLKDNQNLETEVFSRRFPDLDIMPSPNNVVINNIDKQYLELVKMEINSVKEYNMNSFCDNSKSIIKHSFLTAQKKYPEFNCVLQGFEDGTLIIKQLNIRNDFLLYFKEQIH